MLGLNHVRRKSQNCRGIVGELGGPSQDGRASELHAACTVSLITIAALTVLHVTGQQVGVPCQSLAGTRGASNIFKYFELVV